MENSDSEYIIIPLDQLFYLKSMTSSLSITLNSTKTIIEKTVFIYQDRIQLQRKERWTIEDLEN